MKLIIGLGNPGEKYKTSRHNIGFMIIDKAIKAFSLKDLSYNKKFNAEISESIVFGQKFILAKPQTFMNKSGESVKYIVNYFKINIEKDLIIVHDDIDIELGKYKISKNKNSGGHNGIKSIIESLGTKNFSRIRIGIETKERKTSTEKFVLEEFSSDEIKIINQVFNNILKSLY